MKLLRFYIRHHLLLHDLDLRFDRADRLDTGQYALDFLVGVNGSGKSTFLRALVQAFSSLYTNQFNPFDFALEYLLENQDVPQLVIIHRETRDGRSSLKMTIRTRESIIYESDAIDLRYLPRRIIVYSTGNEEEWERLLISSQEEPGTEDASENLLANVIQRTIKELPGSLAEAKTSTADETGEPPFWLMRTSKGALIALCGLLAHLNSENRPLKEVLEAINIESIPGFSLRFRLHSALSDYEQYKKLAKHSTRQVRQGTDYLLYFDFSEKQQLFSNMINEFTSSFELFRVLDKLSNINPDTGQPTLQQVNIFLQRTSPSNTNHDQGEDSTIPNLFLFDWLSDGEQSFLSRMALLAMLDTDDGLILLDEPEVHFNDYWKRKIVQLIDNLMRSHTNQLLMTTHSTILMSDVTADQIFLFSKDEKGVTQVTETVPPLFGSDPGNIMVNLLGTGRAGGEYSKEVLEAAIEKGDREELEYFLHKVGPGYWQFRIIDRLENINAAPK